jgi:cell filamentation protein
MTFDPFGDFDSRGYLRNFPGFKDVSKVKDLEHASFQGNIERAINTLAAIDFIEYKHVLDIHRTLFGDVYPWAGQDRLATAPDINISKGGYGAIFAQPQYIRRVTDYALDRSRDPNVMREQPGYIMGSLAHAHPFLDGNGRTIMILHTEMAHRAGISIDWAQTDKTAYLTALTTELNEPGKGHLDDYLKPFVQGAVGRQQSASVLKLLKGLGATNTMPPSNTNALKVGSGIESELSANIAPKESQTRSKIIDATVTLQQLINLKNYYLNSPSGKAQPESIDAQKNFKRYKAQISKDGKAVTGNKDLRLTNEFFETFKSEAVTLSPEDRANLEAANEFAIEQQQIKAQARAQSQRQSDDQNRGFSR